MKRNSLVRAGVAVSVIVVFGLSAPSLAGAQQASGGNAPIGVQPPAAPVTPAGVQAPAPVQLPRTGNPDGDIASAPPYALAAVVMAAGGALALFRVRRRRFSSSFPRLRQQ
jgi:hypothetical protein